MLLRLKDHESTSFHFHMINVIREQAGNSPHRQPTILDTDFVVPEGTRGQEVQSQVETGP